MTDTPQDSLDNLPPDWEDAAERAVPEASGSDDELVCPNCLTPVQPHAHLCSNCGGPVSDRALLDPFARIWGEGYAYRQATRVGSSPSLVVLIGVWGIFLPGILMFAYFAWLSVEEIINAVQGVTDFFTGQKYSVLEGVWKFLFVVFLMSIQIAIVRRVTQNFLRAQESRTDEK